MLFPLAFVALFFATCMATIAQVSFLQQLKSRHGEVWNSLGRPSIFFPCRISVFLFLWRKAYEPLHDPEFTRVANLLRTFQIAFAVFFAAILLTCSILVATRHI
jgi:hypothetical protein